MIRHDDANRISFKINGVQHSVGSEVSSDMMLVDYLRTVLQLRGTKYMCREGGCGACVVTTSKTTGAPSISVNSCLTSITSCQDWDITTIEGLGNRKIGYHPLQTTLANKNGTQCGHCSPGFVMSMHGVLEAKKNPTMLEIEKSFGSNICRCTGYRPILDAFKTYASDAPKSFKIKDMEDLSICKKNGNVCNKTCDEDEWCLLDTDDEIKLVELSDGRKWYVPGTLQDVLTILAKEGTDSYMLVGGNTAKGVVPIESYPKILINISRLKELRGYSCDQNLIIGAATTITELMDLCDVLSTTEYFEYLTVLNEHHLLVAHVPVRNVGTIAGNLMLKHGKQSFQSDIFLILTTVGAELSIMSSDGTKQNVTMVDFLKLDMVGKIIVSILLPPLKKDEHILETFKIMPRSQSVPADCNAGFLFKVDANNMVETACIVYGGLSESFVRATITETYLVGKYLFSNETLQGALKTLDAELIVDANPPEPSVEYRKYLAKGLFFKALLIHCPASLVDPRFASGTIKLHDVRPVSKGSQTYSTNPMLYPFNQPIPKLEALIQCAGEAKYTEDIPSFPNEVFGAFVMSTIAVGTISDIDPSEALAMDGVVAFYTSKDIPGRNSFTPNDQTTLTNYEEILCSGKVKFYNQPLGIIVATTQHVANRAINYVKVTYTDTSTPVVDIKVAKKDSTRNTLSYDYPATNPGTDISKTITGNTTIYGQYHCTMETLVSVARPTEEGLEVHTATQWLDLTQLMLSRALLLPQNKIDVHVRRIGGGYGMKLTRCIQSAIACSLVVLKLNRPCRFIQPLTTNFRAIGKRLPCSNDFVVSVDKNGVIQQLDSTIYEDNGYEYNETLSALTLSAYYNCYDVSKINYKVYETLTDTAKNTWCRSPGSLEAISFMEHVVERIAYELDLDPVVVRLANINTSTYSEMTNFVNRIRTDNDFESRRAAVAKFNKENRWKKKGLRMAIARWTSEFYTRLDMNLSVFHGDGTVIISHSLVEMGQGVNTKAAQVAARCLNIPLDKIQIKGMDTTMNPNSEFTGASLGTHTLVIGVKKCCDELLSRLSATRSTLTNPTWEDLIVAAYTASVDLQVHGFTGVSDLQGYDVYGATICESEIDVITGEHEMLRVDILQDVGVSISPELDIGQVEGGFMMGAGYWTSEKLVYDQNTGEILTNRTLNYHVPQARDIPQVLNIALNKNSYSNDVILGSKGTGEPAVCSTVCVAFALREAVAAARLERGKPTTEYFETDGPWTTETIAMASLPDVTCFAFN